MKKCMLVILLILIMPLNVLGYTKNDILSLTEGVKICDNSTSITFDTYQVLLLRMLNERDLTTNEINSIYNKLDSALDLVNEHKLCTINDIKSSDSKVKNSIYNYLYDSLKILENAKKYTGVSSNSSGINIDTADGTISIVSDGNISDKIKVEELTLNEVGVNRIVKYSAIIFGTLCIFCLSCLILKKIVSPNSQLRNIIVSLFFVSSLCFSILLVFSSELSTFFNTISLISVKNKGIAKEVVYKDNKIISYPSYGSQYGTITINKKRSDVYFGDSVEVLKKGVGHYNGSYMPGEGGTIIYDGHNTIEAMKALKNIKKGNFIIVETVYGTFKYKVIKTEIVNDGFVDILKVNNKSEQLVIYTCYPFDNILYESKRLVVYATLNDMEITGDSGV